MQLLSKIAIHYFKKFNVLEIINKYCELFNNKLSITFELS